MSTTRAADENLHQALAHLNEAARERREEIRKLVDEEYGHLRNAFGGAARASAGWMSEQGKEVTDTAKATATAVDKHVRSHPWHYVGGAAAAGFLTGLIIGRRK